MAVGLDPEIYEEKHEFFSNYGKPEYKTLNNVVDITMFSAVLFLGLIGATVLAITAAAVVVGDLICNLRFKLRVLWWKITWAWPWTIKRWFWFRRKNL